MATELRQVGSGRAVRQVADGGSMMRITAALAMTAGLVVSLVGLVPGSASAESGGAARETAKVKVAMQTVPVVGVTRSGEKFAVSLANGRQVNLSAGEYAQWSSTESGAETLSRLTSGEVSTAGVTVGNCGSEWLWIWGIGYSQLKVQTGWELISSVIRSEIWVNIMDNGGSSTRYYGTSWDDGHWNIEETLKGMTRGFAQAWVDSDSYAILSNGQFCFTLGPSDTTTIT